MRAMTRVRPRVALVIPAWDEAESIGAVLAEVPPEAADVVYVVVGPGADATADIAASHGAVPLRTLRRGYGRACWAGAQAAVQAGAEIVAFLDGDYSDPPGELPRLLEPLLAGRADLALGCRDLSASPEALPRHARLGNRAVLAFLNARLRPPEPLRDLPSFKVIRADWLCRLEMREMTYGWTVELLAKAARLHLRIAQARVGYRPRLGGRSKVSGTVRGTLGAAWKLCSCAARYASWRPAPGCMAVAEEVT